MDQYQPKKMFSLEETRIAIETKWKTLSSFFFFLIFIDLNTFHVLHFFIYFLFLFILFLFIILLAVKGT